MAFDPKRYVIKVQGGREYLPVSARLIWFRNDHPDWGIVTEAVEINHEKQYSIFRATIFNEEGRLIATATKKEDVKGFGDYIEKAETGSVGRALAMCGYGAQFAPELEESAPRRGAAPMRPAPGPANFGPPQRVAPPPAGGRFDDDDVPMPIPPSRPAPPQERPAPMQERPAPRPMAADLPADLPPLRPASSLQRPAPRPMPNDAPPAPLQARPATTGASIQRVREPERDLIDPGGDEEDLDDPFAEEDAPPPPRPPARAAAPRPAPRKPADSLL